MNNLQNLVVMDLTQVSSTLPQLGDPNIPRDNMISLLERMLSDDTEAVIVEGPDGMGKTTLLAQFAHTFPHQTFGLFMRSASRWAYDSQMLTRDLCDQIGWVLEKENYRNNREVDTVQLLRTRILDLQRQANSERKTYYFIVDGLQEIPEEDSHERDVILSLLPFGIPHFRFILSGSSSYLQKRLKKIQVHSFPLAGFTFDETRMFFSGFIDDSLNLETVFKVTKGIPGNQASIRRLLQAGAEAGKLLEELPERLPDLFELEWRAVEKEDNELLRNALAILTFDQRRHSLDSLSQLCKIDSSVLKEMLNCCNFVEQRNNGQEVEFVCDVFKRYAAKRLSSLQKTALNTAISDLINSPESHEALTHLPGLFHMADRYEELLTYLSPQHIGKLIDCSDSWAPLHQKADLGMETSLSLARDGDTLRFSLQRATITSMESSEPWRSEIEAYVALDDFATAYALVQQVATREDRLHLLAVIARMKKTKSLPIELELKDQIQQLYMQLDRNSLGGRGVEIASDLLYTHPELAIELVQECTDKTDSEGKLDFALLHLSFKALLEKPNEMDDMESTHLALRNKVKDPKIQKFMDTLPLFFGSYSAEGVIAEVDKWEKTSDRIYALRAWAVTNARREDAALVVEYGINTILQTTTYTANAKVYQELVSPLVYISSFTQIKQIVGRLDGLKGPIESAGPTVEYVQLQVTLAEAESRYDKHAAEDRLLELYFYIGELTELGTKLTALAVLVQVIKKISETELHSGLYSSVIADLESVVDEILSKTADHYEAVRLPIGALARNNSKAALEIIAKLNTVERREAALVTLIEVMAAEPPTNDNFAAIEDAYRKLKSIPMRAKAARAALQGLSSQKKALTSFLPKLYVLSEWIYIIPDAEEKCQALCIFLEILFEHKDVVPLSLLSSLEKKLDEAWSAVDSGWSKINAGFKIVSLMANYFPDISRKFLTQTENARKEIILDCHDMAITYFLCVQLTIRSFVGLLKRKHYHEDDLEDLKNLIDKIPATRFRVIAWSELALRFFVARDHARCQEIVSEQILPILEPDVISDQDALWDAIICAAPVLYSAHTASAKQMISRMPQPYRDNAYNEICSFLISKRLPMESYDSASKPLGKIDYEDCLHICELLDCLETDSAIYWHIENLVSSIYKGFNNSFNKSQTADIQQKLRNIATTKFPSQERIQHEGFKILAEAQIARLDRQSNVWNDLAVRAKAISNLADRAFVLMQIASVMPAKEKSHALVLMQEAKTLISQIPFFEDRCSHYETLAQLSADIDKQFSKECLRQAWNETVPREVTELAKARRSIIDFAHRLDPDFAASLASETDNDPGRDFVRAQTKQRLEVLNLREHAAAGEKSALLTLTQDKKQQIEIAKMLLAGLNSSRVNPMHMENTRPFIKHASHMNLQDAYTVLSWIIENAVRRHSDTDQSKTLLRSLYDATRLSSELAFKIATRIRSVTDQGIRFARQSESSTDSLIRPKEREKAFSILREWASKATGFIKITDPYFGVDELDFIKQIRSVNSNIPIYILTSRKHQQDSRIQQPWDETYSSHWRLSISDSDPGVVEIIMIGKEGSGDHPIHDRWWVTEKSGLRIGTSANSLGLGRVSEVSNISEEHVTSMLLEIDQYISGSVRSLNNERLKYSSFYL